MFISIGFFEHDYSNISFWKQEVENGVLALRITSVIIIFSIVGKILTVARIANWPDESRGMTYTPGMSTVGERIILKLSPDIIQLYLYMIMIYFLYTSVISGMTGLHISITSWALLFIIDDWKIVSDYKNIANINILKWHHIKLISFNSLLIISSSLVINDLILSSFSNVIICVMISSLISIELILNYLIKVKITTYKMGIKCFS